MINVINAKNTGSLINKKLYSNKRGWHFHKHTMRLEMYENFLAFWYKNLNDELAYFECGKQCLRSSLYEGL